MSIPSTYVKTLKSCEDAIKRTNEHLKSLRAQHKTTQERLYKYMNSHNLTEFEGIKIQKIKPKEKTPRKKESEKKNDAIQLFSEIGAENPEELWKRVKEIHKAKKKVEEETEAYGDVIYV